MLFIAIGFVVAHIALATAIFALRGGDQLLVLGVVFGWYCFAMFGLIVYLWVRHRKSTGEDSSLKAIAVTLALLATEHLGKFADLRRCRV